METTPCIVLFVGPTYTNGILQQNVLDPTTQTQKPVLECHQNCKCHTSGCDNRLVGNQTMPQIKVFPTDGKGRGVRTQQQILKSQFVCEYVGEVITRQTAEKRIDKESTDRNNQTYIVTVNEDFANSSTQYFIDARHYGNIARFINHSCEPNLVSVIVRVGVNLPRLALFASGDIAPGEELTFRYGDEKSALSKCKCLCGSSHCLGFLPHDGLD